MLTGNMLALRRCSGLCINHPLSTRGGWSTRCRRGRRVQVGRAGPIGHCRRCSTSDAAQDAGVAGAGRCWRFKVRGGAGPAGWILLPLGRNIRAVNSVPHFGTGENGPRPAISLECGSLRPRRSGGVRCCGGCRATRSCPRTHRRRLRHGSQRALRARRRQRVSRWRWSAGEVAETRFDAFPHR